MKLTEPRRRMLTALNAAGGSVSRDSLLHRAKAYASGYRVLDVLETNGLIELRYPPTFSTGDVWVKLTTTGKDIVNRAPRRISGAGN